MKCMVTGGTGFLGQSLVNRLLSLGHQVTVIGRNEHVGEKLKARGVTFIRADLTERNRVLTACEGMDYVFHAAALSSPWGAYDTFYKSNVVATINVIDACQKHGVKRLIHVSTPSLYFSFHHRRNIKEEDPLPKTFVNAYAETKYLAELEVDRAHKEGLPVITIRPRALFGPGDTTILPRLIRANEKGVVPLINGGRAIMDITYVENVVDALLLCLSSPSDTLGKKYNITNDEPIRLVDVLEAVFEKLGQPFKAKRIPYPMAYHLAGGLEWVATHLKKGEEPLMTRYTVGVLSKSQTLDISRAKEELGYHPSVSLHEGMDHFVKWWKENQHDH